MTTTLSELVPDAITFLDNMKPLPGAASSEWQDGWNDCREEFLRLAALAPPSGEGVDSKCPHCGAPTRKEILMRGGDNGWGDDASRTVYRYATPQSAPVDGDWIEWNGGNCPVSADTSVEYRLRNGSEYTGWKASDLDWLHNTDALHPDAEIIAYRLTTPPPASQERGDADRVIRRLWSLMGPKVPPCCEGCNFEWTKAIEEMRNYLGGDAYPAASPPSSAAEHRLEMFTKSPGLHEAGCPLSGTPNLYASCDCGLGAAEQAKPDASESNMTTVERRDMLLKTTPATVPLIDHGIASVGLSEQAGALAELTGMENRLRKSAAYWMDGDLSNGNKAELSGVFNSYANRLADIIPRLAGGVTSKMIGAAMDAYVAKRKDRRGVVEAEAMRAAMIAALEAK